MWASRHSCMCLLSKCLSLAFFCSFLSFFLFCGREARLNDVGALTLCFWQCVGALRYLRYLVAGYAQTIHGPASGDGLLEMQVQLAAHLTRHTMSHTSHTSQYVPHRDTSHASLRARRRVPLHRLQDPFRAQRSWNACFGKSSFMCE